MEAGMGSKHVCLENLPPEVSSNNIHVAMSQFGNVQAIQEETWAKHYHYNVSNGVKIVTMTLPKHIPSYMVIDGHRALTSYDSQPQTCYGCGDTDHMYHACPKCRVAKATTTAPANPMWADITAAMAPPSSDPGVSDNNNMVINSYPQPTQTVSPIPMDDSLERMEMALSAGWPASHEESRTDKPVTPDQVHGAPSSSKSADEIPDLDMDKPVVSRPSSGALAADEDWAPLPKTDMDHHSATDL
jgi:hypothetical protein